MRELVVALSEAGHRLAVLTNKPVRISFDIVAALGLAQHFMRVYGGDSFPAKKPIPPVSARSWTKPVYLSRLHC